MKIYQIRGTSGSGKTTVMRNFMKPNRWEQVHSPGRKKPLMCYNENDLIVLGDYESLYGGCDTIGSAKAVYELIQKLAVGSYNGKERAIVCEGLLLSEDTKWALQLRNEGHELKILFLTTLPQECLNRIKSRRAKAGNEKPLNPNNTLNRLNAIERAYQKLSNQENITVRRCQSKHAVSILLNWTDINSPET